MNDWPGEQPEHDHPFPPCPACAWALRKLEAELIEARRHEHEAIEAYDRQYARAEKAEARVAELEAERVEEQKRWLLEHETR